MDPISDADSCGLSNQANPEFPCDSPKKQSPKTSAHCNECNIALASLIFGHPFQSRVQIYRWIIGHFYKQFYCVSSNWVSEILRQDHNEVIMAMKELKEVNSSMFELKEERDQGPLQITELGYLFMEKCMVHLAGSGMLYESFLRIFPVKLINFAVSEEWLEITSLSQDLQPVCFVHRGPNWSVCELLRASLNAFKVKNHITAYEKHKLLLIGLIAPGPITPIFKLKAGIKFPFRDHKELFCLWIKMIKTFLIKEKHGDR